MLIITPKFTEKDVQNLLVLLNEAVKAIGINSVREVTRIADLVQIAIDEAKMKEAAQQLTPNVADGEVVDVAA